MDGVEIVRSGLRMFTAEWEGSRVWVGTGLYSTYLFCLIFFVFYMYGSFTLLCQNLRGITAII